MGTLQEALQGLKPEVKSKKKTADRLTGAEVSMMSSGNFSIRNDQNYFDEKINLSAVAGDCFTKILNDLFYLTYLWGEDQGTLPFIREVLKKNPRRIHVLLVFLKTNGATSPDKRKVYQMKKFLNLEGEKSENFEIRRRSLDLNFFKV